ncbi:MAG: hypothetical protein COT38_04775 [Candidatus Omnitrophica bacterium CG08_land_8_20_14_0_20_41_16]|nr:MAG: hypothetical protein COT38_04775 [Candidatus Omnitrophica bacterium CG08_land_8_20_14_0_20_41_16]
MNLQRPNANDATGTFNRSKNVVPGSGICSRCIDGCKGNCEVGRFKLLTQHFTEFFMRCIKTKCFPRSIV